jgi:DNA-binding NtrC family response regulator
MKSPSVIANSQRTILVIDDNEGVRASFEILLSVHRMQVLTAATPSQALDILAQQAVNLVIQDMNFSREAITGEEGVDLFRAIRSRHPDLPIILLTAWTRLETAVELVKAGAADYIAKPWDDARILTTIRNLLDLSDAKIEAQQLRHQQKDRRESLASKFNLCDVVYESDAMHALIATATQISHADVPVLITGPNGTGKEVLANIVQANSSVRTGPYVKLNLGALPENLIEAELFGTESGAFTGARSRAGRFDAARGGTLFLDEIGNLSASGQAKLLRVLQSGEFTRLGSNTTRRADVRVIAATNTDLRSAVQEGRFREDLLYRLNVIELNIPPLASRPADILPLAQSFIEEGFELDAGARTMLTRHLWPGNVRELQNVLRRACLLAGGQLIGSEHLGLGHVTSHSAVEPTLSHEIIKHALDQANGVIAHAARELGLSRQALYRRMEKLQIVGSHGHVGTPSDP